MLIDAHSIRHVDKIQFVGMSRIYDKLKLSDTRFVEQSDRHRR
jgi:hypothetical protein